jgi:hypothetical protein
MNCNRAIKCPDNTIQYCVRKYGHAEGCNPFEDIPPTIGNEREKREENIDRIEIVYHKALRAAELVGA